MTFKMCCLDLCNSVLLTELLLEEFGLFLDHLELRHMGTYVFAAIFVGAKSLQLSRAGCEHQNG